jgi:GTP cyclohydrolase IA
MTYQDIINDSKLLAKKIKEVGKQYSGIFGVPSGGILPAFIISQDIGIPFLDYQQDNCLIIDDLIDSGRTLQKYTGYDWAVLYRKKHSPLTSYFLKEVDGWIDLPHEKDETADIEDHITRILEYIGENPNREGLIDTPKRVVKMYKEIFRGYNERQKPQITVFDNGKDGIFYDQMIIDTGDFYSQCEHHTVPFFGKYYFAYIPDKKIIGLSKVARIVDYYSAKLQIQERLVKEIVDEIEKVCQPKGIALIMKGEHLCKTMRGCKKKGKMITSDMRGGFKDNSETRNEFLKLCDL